MKEGDYIEDYILGTLLNEVGNQRKYFITEHEKWFFKRMMFKLGWNFKSERSYVYKGVAGFEITLERNYDNANN